MLRHRRIERGGFFGYRILTESIVDNFYIYLQHNLVTNRILSRVSAIGSSYM